MVLMALLAILLATSASGGGFRRPSGAPLELQIIYVVRADAAGTAGVAFCRTLAVQTCRPRLSPTRLSSRFGRQPPSRRAISQKTA